MGLCFLNVFFIALFATFVVSTLAANHYLWGEIGPGDVLIAKDTVSKAFFVGLVVTEKYVFKQKDNLNAYTITAIKVTDKKKKGKGATAELINGGPGSKGCTIKFKSQRGSGIKDIVEIYGR